VRVLDLVQHWPGEPTPIDDDGADVFDWITQHDLAGSRLAALAKEAPLWEPGGPRPQHIIELGDIFGSDRRLIMRHIPHFRKS
jgi:hypothetical protein